MRQILFFLLIISVLTRCSGSENIALDKELQNLSDPTQLITISNNKTSSITARNGAKITIESNSFEFNDGQLPDKPIQVEIKEVYDKSDMILNGLGTTSDGQLLESLGMIFIKATSGERELHIKDGQSITVSIPNKKGGYTGELFYGEKTDSILNWRYAGTTKDTIEVIETIMPISNDRTPLKRTTYKVVNGSREIVSDTIIIMEGMYGYDSAMSTPQEAFEFEIKNMGWINCDRFIEVVEKIDLEIKLKKHSQPIGYLVFNSINSVMPIIFNEKGEAMLRNLPKDYNVDIVIIDKIKNNFMWVQKALKIRSDSKVTLETIKTSKEELKASLKKFDK